MSDTIARTDAQRQLAEYDRQLAEPRKLMAESDKFAAEQRKLLSESPHLDRQRSVAFVATTGAGAALIALILRLPGVIQMGGSDA